MTASDQWNTIAVDLAKRGKIASAVAAMRRAVDMEPNRPDHLGNYGNMLRRYGKHAEAGKWLQRSLDLDPQFPPTLYNLACWHMDNGEPNIAIGLLDGILNRVNSTDPDWRLARAAALLMAGRFQEGWAEYEVRLEDRDWGDLPLWDGMPLNGKTLLLHAEQGLGDTIMYHRFVGRRNTAIHYVVPPVLSKLLHAQSIHHNIGKVDCHLPLMSLPHVLGASEMNGRPYIDDRGLPLMTLNIPPGTRARVGIVWKAKANWKVMKPDELLHGIAKTMPLETMLELTRLKGVALYSLQTDSSDIDDLEAGHLVTDLGRKIHDFHDLASYMKMMDVIVTVDTAPAHLAGAMGIPTVVCTHRQAAWQWGTTSRSLWYNSCKIVRMVEDGVWPMDDICTAVENILIERAAEAKYA